MDTCTLDVLHNTWDNIVCTVTDCVNLDFLTHHILVDENRIFKTATHDDFHILDDILIGVSNNHILTAENVGRTHKNRVAQLFSSLERFLCVHYCEAFRTWDSTLVEKLVKTFSVLSSINAVSRSTEDIYAHIGEMLCKLDSGLTAELYNNTIWLFSFDDSFNVLTCERVEVESVACVEVGGNSFRVVVADNSFVAHFLQCPYTVYGAVVELDTLTDTDRT